MKIFREIFKELARTKQLTRYHVVQNCILRTMRLAHRCKFDFDASAWAEVADSFIREAFAPITRKVKLDNGCDPWDAVSHTLQDLPRFFGDNDLFDTKQEFAQYAEIVGALQKKYEKPLDYYSRYYFYVFVRQDISPEYQAVQACHVAAKMGSRFQEYCTPEFPAKQFDELYITLVGVPDIKGLEIAIEDIKSVGGKVYAFCEPDLDDELTAVASSPIRADQRKRLMSYKRLVFHK